LRAATVPRDLERAFSLFRQAAEAGDAGAQADLAATYFSGNSEGPVSDLAASSTATFNEGLLTGFSNSNVEGVTAAEAIAQALGNKDVHPHGLDRNNIPGCTYCHPQIASVGLTETKAKDAGYALKVGTFPFIGNGKAIALGEAEGFIKTVFDAKTGELLGAHMIGAEVTELIQGYAVGKTLETTEAELMQTVFPHPTLSEMMHESVLAAYGRALHI
jgi:TPR repeat protein